MVLWGDAELAGTTNLQSLVAAGDQVLMGPDAGLAPTRILADPIIVYTPSTTASQAAMHNHIPLRLTHWLVSALHAHRARRRGLGHGRSTTWRCLRGRARRSCLGASRRPGPRAADEGTPGIARGGVTIFGLFWHRSLQVIARHGAPTPAAVKMKSAWIAPVTPRGGFQAWLEAAVTQRATGEDLRRSAGRADRPRASRTSARGGVQRPGDAGVSVVGGRRRRVENRDSSPGQDGATTSGLPCAPMLRHAAEEAPRRCDARACKYRTGRGIIDCGERDHRRPQDNDRSGSTCAEIERICSRAPGAQDRSRSVSDPALVRSATPSARRQAVRKRSRARGAQMADYKVPRHVERGFEPGRGAPGSGEPPTGADGGANAAGQRTVRVRVPTASRKKAPVHGTTGLAGRRSTTGAGIRRLRLRAAHGENAATGEPAGGAGRIAVQS